MLVDWNSITEGVESGRVQFTITDEMVDEHIQAAGLGPDWLGPQHSIVRGEGRIAPPDMMSRLWGTDLIYRFQNATIGPSVRYKQVYTFHAPVLVGMEIVASGTLTRKYEKRDRKFVQYEVKFLSTAGKLLVVDERTQMLLGVDFQASS